MLALQDIVGLGTAGDCVVGCCGDNLRLGTARILCGSELKVYCAVGELQRCFAIGRCRDIMLLGTVALQ